MSGVVYDFAVRSRPVEPCTPLLQASLPALEWSVIMPELHTSSSEMVREIAAKLQAMLEHPSAAVPT